MKTTTKLISASALALLAISTATTSVLADPLAPSTATSTGKVGIKEGTDTKPTDPVDPTDPTKPIDPSKPIDPGDPDNPGTGNPGPLSIDYVSNINFGMNDYSGDAITISPMKLDADGNATTTPIERNPWVQLTDKRNTGKGWTLSVNYDADGWISTDGTKKPLKGAVLTLGDASFTAKDSSNQSGAPTHPGDIATTQIGSDSQIIGQAGTDAGMGTWFEEFDKTTTTLMIPAGNTAGSYQANLNWTLAEVPEA
ncbi:hypothetical protein RD055328_12270 [Companilactobacillus sp. RD055328]|uniref:WxL domain-containing protein n=1 Tax=Companilactobacillus sp. RD055328 TaxID=2916634 RepID=UPI001FC83ECE|nr:WxL domain-containing protein [Companilactobacillus sp. RD055328]GKQ43304.1 hypothetical protein RD055328_12270 [Companilactobacillus sp. RD055328]